MRPLSMISFEQPNDKWEMLDFLLVKAYEQVQALRCPLCGGWLWECSSEVAATRNIDYGIREVHCRKTAKIEAFENSKLPDKERCKEAHRTRKWGLWHKSSAAIPKEYANLPGYKMPTIEAILGGKQ